MQQKINWIVNLRGIACLMVVMIHTTVKPVTNPNLASILDWEFANLLNSASRACVPLFFMISGYLFFGERSAKPHHFLRIWLCLLFYSLIALIYMWLLTPMNVRLSLVGMLQKPVFYHLWFFFSIIVIYMLSPLIQVKAVGPYMLLALMLIIGILGNPNITGYKIPNLEWLPIGMEITGDTFYFVFYGLLGRAIGNMEIQRRWISWLSSALFIVAVLIIAAGTHHGLTLNGYFVGNWYIYCGPAVFIAAVSLFVVVKTCLNQRPIPGLAIISRYSLGIYGFHALIIHALRTHGVELKTWPVLDIAWVFIATLAVSLLLSMGLQRLDVRRFVS